jgi:hypothetical protein
MHKLKINKNGEEIDITNFSGNINLSDSLESLGRTLNFDMSRNYNDSNFKIAEDLSVGDAVIFTGKETELFFGVIVDISLTKYKKSCKCLDLAFYLNKNKVIKQFKGVAANTAIKNLCKGIGVPTGTIASMATAITKIYKNKTVAEIILDILQQVTDETGKKYRLEVNDRKLDIKEEGYKKVSALYNLQGDIDKTYNILDMKNAILVTSNNQDEINISAEKKDETNIKKYGMLQEIVQVDPKDISKVRNIASKKLEELNKVFTKASIEVLGTDELRSGRYIEVINVEFELNGDYLIKNCSHTYQNVHKTTLELEVV